jgi:hypothetical protein
VDGKGYPFFSGCHLFGSKAKGDEDNHILSIFAWKSIRQNLPDEGNLFWLTSLDYLKHFPR